MLPRAATLSAKNIDPEPRRREVEGPGREPG